MKKELKWIKSRIEKLNRIIDSRIISGKSYKMQSREHADLRAYLNILTANA